MFFKGVGINDGLEYLRQLDITLEENELTRVTHIAIIAGELADRGISFVSSEYHWHPTSMYYVPSAGATVSHIIQAAGRLCGNFDDDIPLQLFAPSETLENLKRGINLQEDCLERAKINAKGCAVTVIQGMAISTDKIPTRPMGHQVENEEVAIRANAIEGQDEGVDLAVFKENEIKPMLPGDTTDEETKGETKKHTHEETKGDEDPQKGLEAVAKAYTKKNGLVRKIINAFVAADFASLSKIQLQEVCGKTRIVFNDFTTWNVARGRYQLLAKTSRDKYNLRASIVYHLELV